MIAVRRGDVVLARLDPTLGVEIKKTRPVIVLSNDSINHFAELAVVVPLTTNTARLSPSHALIPHGAAGLKSPSRAVTEQIRAIDKRRLVKRLGHLAPQLLAEVERALQKTLALA
jgi:mRNA interferase MazF